MKWTSLITTLVTINAFYMIPAFASDSVYPIHQCDHRKFNVDREGCKNWQMYWDEQSRNSATGYWANCSWNPAAWACWKLEPAIWRCPPKGGLDITRGKYLALHDWAVKVFRSALEDKAWDGHPRASRAWEYLNGATLDLLGLTLTKQAQIEDDFSKLDSTDIVRLAEILLKYSSVNDTEDWFKYMLDRIPGCSMQPTTMNQLILLRSEWSDRVKRPSPK